MTSPSERREDTSKTHTLVNGVSAASPETSPRIALLFEHQHSVEAAVLRPGMPIVVGRSPQGGLRIEDPTLSREHARFELRDDRVLVHDLRSKNKVLHRGKHVQHCELDIGDEVLLGAVRVRVQALSASGESLGIDNEGTFRRRVEEEHARAAQFRRPFALLLARAVNANDSTAAATDRGWLATVRQRVRTVDRMAPYGAAAVLLLLPETGQEDAVRLAQALAAPILHSSCRLLVGIAVYPATAQTDEQMLEQCCQAARNATPEHPVSSAPTTARPIPGGDQVDLVAGQAMQPIIETAMNVADSRLPVILHGETGTGKELLARLLHDRSPRKAGRIVRVNCGALPKDLIESTLFGHEKGAFTGAANRQKGVFEEADGGTVFLDEIGELPPSAQAVLLRVLETSTFSRIGSNHEIRVDVRVVAATHRDLEAMSEIGTFRADLYYRLSGVVINIPPLRDRSDEIDPLVAQFLQAANQANGRCVSGVAPEAMALLRTYAWPGNVRELRNAVERAVVVARGKLIVPDDLPARVQVPRGDGTPTSTDMAGAVGSAKVMERSRTSPATENGRVASRDAVQQFEARILRQTLESAGWNRSLAAAKLGMPVRTLSYRMSVLKIRKPHC